MSEIAGVSARSARIVLGCLGNKCFKSKDALVAYTELDVVVEENGSSIKKRGYLTKRGKGVLRLTATQVAWGLQTHNQKFRELAVYYKAQGKHYFEIMVILARKFLHIVYGVMRNGTHFLEFRTPKNLKMPMA